MAARPFADTQPPGSDPAEDEVPDGQADTADDSMGRRKGAGAGSAFEAMVRDRERAAPEPGGVDIPL